MKSFLLNCLESGIENFEANLAAVILDEVASGEREHQYFMSCGDLCFYLFDSFTIYSWGDGLNLQAPCDKPEDALLNCAASWQDMGFASEAEQFSSFGLKPEFEEVAAGEECCIWVSRNFYSTTCGAPRDSYLCDENSSDPVVFADKAAAQEWIDEANAGIYFESHGECGRPDYKIVPLF